MLRAIFLIILSAVAFAQQSNAQSSTLGNLPAGGAVAGTDLFYDVQVVGVGGVKITATQLATFFSTNLPMIATTTFQSNGSVPIDGGGSCTATSFAGGATAGTFVAPSCVAGTIAITFAFTAPIGWSCDAQDRTTTSDTLKQTATTTTKATFAATTAVSDVVQYKCIAY